MLTRGLQGAMLHYFKKSEHSMQFSILRKQLKAMSRLAATSDIRYYLNGLHVVQDNRGTYIEATNGHILGRLLIDATPAN